MPKIPMPYTVHLDHTLRVTPLSTLFAKGDSSAHRFELTILRAGVQEDLTGCTVVCKFYRIADSMVVSVPGSVEDGKAVTVLGAACYDYIGRFALTIAIQNGEEETTVFYGDGYMSGNRADTGITGDYVVYDVETLLAKIAEIETAIANANTATENANTAAENANAAAENANAAASGAQSAAGSANAAASAANTAAQTANTAASVAQTATENANAATQSSQAQQQAVSEAEAERSTAEQERQTAEQERAETFAGYEERIVAATPDDATVNGRSWSSKKTVDSLCMPLEATGNPVQCYPVEGYPLGVRVSWEPVQEGSGDPSPDNVRPITGRDALSVTISSGTDSSTADIALPETVYGGTLDLETGVVTVEKGMKAFSGDESFSVHSSAGYFAYVENCIITDSKTQYNIHCDCSHYKPNSWAAINKISAPGNQCAVFYGDSKIVFHVVDTFSSVDDFKSYLAEQYANGTPVTVTYTLNTPYTIQLTPQQIAALSGVNTLYTDAGALTITGREDPRHTIDRNKPVPSYEYGVNLLDRMTAEQLHSKVAAGDFTGIRNGDYVEVVLNGSFWDYGTYTCPSGTTYYSDIGLATSAGTTSGALKAIYVNNTYCEITVSGTKYYVATSACDDHFVSTLKGAVMKFEANIDFYYKYGDIGLSGGAHHIAFVSRDLLPVLLKMRKENGSWTDTETDNPWLGSALYKTFNDTDHGILALMAATSIGPYIYAGPNGKGMRFLGEKKAEGARTATGLAWYDRGKLWVPSEREVWGADVFSEHTNGAGLALQMPVFAGSLRHIVKGLGNNGSRYAWWCLSSIAGTSTNFCRVYDYGVPNNSPAAPTWVGAPVGFIFA